MEKKTSNTDLSTLAELVANAINEGTTTSDEPIAAQEPNTPETEYDGSEDFWLNMFINGGTRKIESSFKLWANNRRQKGYIDLFSSDAYWGKDPMGVVYLREFGTNAIRFNMDSTEDFDENGKAVSYTNEEKSIIEDAVNAAYDEISADNSTPSEAEEKAQRKHGSPTGVLVLFIYDLNDDDELELIQIPGVQKLRSKIDKDKRTTALWAERPDVGMKVRIQPRWNDGDKNDSINIGQVLPKRMVVAD